MTKPDWESTHRALLIARGFSPPAGMDVTPKYGPEVARKEIQKRARAEVRELERQEAARSRVFNSGRPGR